MKVIGINGSPRKKGNTSALLNKALKGCKDSGANVELINLYDYTYKGCISCFLCKKKAKEPGCCYYKDELSSVLDKVYEADALIVASPIYFGNVSGMMESFIERLAFPCLSYDNYSERYLSKKINSLLLLTMNVKDEKIYTDLINLKKEWLKLLGGKVNHYCMVNTVQFDDYNKYRASGFDVEEKYDFKDENYDKQMEEAYRLGKEILK